MCCSKKAFTLASGVVRYPGEYYRGRFSRMATPPIRRPARTFSDLVVWQRAHQFVLAVYALTADFPKQETYGLALQKRRAAVSISANITEGFRKRGKAVKIRYLDMAKGSVEESRYYRMLVRDLGYGQTGTVMGTLEEVNRLLNAYPRRF